MSARNDLTMRFLFLFLIAFGIVFVALLYASMRICMRSRKNVRWLTFLLGLVSTIWVGLVFHQSVFALITLIAFGLGIPFASLTEKWIHNLHVKSILHNKSVFFLALSLVGFVCILGVGVSRYSPDGYERNGCVQVGSDVVLTVWNPLWWDDEVLLSYTLGNCGNTSERRSLYNYRSHPNKDPALELIPTKSGSAVGIIEKPDRLTSVIIIDESKVQNGLMNELETAAGRPLIPALYMWGPSSPLREKREKLGFPFNRFGGPAE